ncbi:MAG: hypothetical protein ABSH32_13870 [Bryobacteraceae bacterium]|jgi:hypothetical protein
MITLGTWSQATLQALGAMLLFSTAGTAQIPGLCNTGQTLKNIGGCTGVLVPPNPTGGGTHRDGNWTMAYPYPVTLSESQDPCSLRYIHSWVDTPNAAWLPNSASTASEWITPYDGEDYRRAGYYVYATVFPIPDSPAPTSFTINGQLASDNPTIAIYFQTPAAGGNCQLVSGQAFPVNPAGVGNSDFQQWWPFSFTNSQPLAVASPAVLFFVVQNPYDGSFPNGASPIGLRVEFFSTSTFQ